MYRVKHCDKEVNIIEYKAIDVIGEKSIKLKG
jgi:hypothetical protein